MSARSRCAMGAAIGSGAVQLSGLGLLRADGLLMAFALVALAMAVDLESEAGHGPSEGENE